jgi:hypothetical protein
MAQLQATEVFTPGAYPTHTYIERTDKRYEDRLKDALATPGQVISLSGPSKSGKTVLVERVVGKDSLITITGAGITHPDDVWNRVLDWMDLPSETSRNNVIEGTATLGGELNTSAQVPFIVKGELTGKAEGQLGASTASTKTRRRRGLRQIIDEIAGSDFVVLIDDFHYMPREIQEEVAKQIKEAVRESVKIVTAAVSHRSDDVVRANPELRGRVMALDLDYWESHNLGQIATRGFSLLNTELNPGAVETFVAEAAGSPQLMQAICLNACFDMGVRSKLEAFRGLVIGQDQFHSIFERTSFITDFRSLVDVLDSGPKTRGTERKTYQFKDGTEGDVYRCILKAIAQNPPRLSYSYDDILHRVRAICVNEQPVGSSIIGSCLHMAKLALEKFPSERVIDWDEQKLVFDIPDPYLLFYFRWSGRLLELQD